MKRSLTTILLSVISVAMVLMLLVSAYYRFSASPEQRINQSMTDRLFARSFSGPIPDPTPVMIQPRRAAAFGALLVSALLLLLYAHRRRRYILEWLQSWSLLAAGMYVLSRGYPNGIEGARVAAAVLVFATLGAAVLLFKSAHSFRETRPYFSRLWLLYPAMLVWFVAAPGFFTSSTVLAPAYLLAGWAQVRAAMVFAEIFRERKLVGALVLSISLVMVGANHLTIGLFFGPIVASVQFILIIMVLNSLAFLVGALGMHLLAFEDMTYELRIANKELENAQEELKRLATVDALTGCYNRRFLEEVIDRELQRHRRYGTPLSLLFVDIDRFKEINDSYGHDVGDRVLQYVGQFLMRKVRDADYVVRWGGDEFLLVLTCIGTEAAQKVAALKTAFDEARENNDLPPRLRLSIGFAEAPNGATDILPLIREADQSMYADKPRRA